MVGAFTQPLEKENEGKLWERFSLWDLREGKGTLGKGQDKTGMKKQKLRDL